MSKIEFIALGGLDEKGKNCYVLNINDNIFVINCGIFYPKYQILGLESSIPDFEYLKKNKEKIRGVFIGTPTEKNFGSLKYLMDEMTLPVYTTNINADIINLSLNSNIQFNIVESMKSFELNGIKITPFKITNSLPNSVGFIFADGNENIIFLDDCVISSSKAPALANDVLTIIPILNNKNNLLFTGVGAVSTTNSFVSPNFQTQTYFNDLFNENDDRVIIALYSFEMYKITSILNAAAMSGKVVAFTNVKTHALILKMHQYGLLPTFDKYKIVDLATLTNNEKNVVVIIDAFPHAFFTMMSDICDEQNPDLIINSNDTFIFASQTINGLEKKEAELFDLVNKCNAKSSLKIDKKYLDLIPGVEDLKFMAAFIKPKYIVPVNALYMDFVNYQTAMSKTGFLKKNVVILRNGQKMIINDGVINEKTEFVDLNSKLINTQGFIDENDSSILERTQMKDNGALIISYVINTTQKKMIKAKYDNVGVIGQTPQNTNIINTINNEVNADVNKVLIDLLSNKDRIDTKEFKLIVRKLIVKQYEKKFDKKPLVMMSLIFE
ncbi:MAG: ribonuclease J [Mycoplasmataceae bacterium]|jgi:ribonuclease J|nr:ribonuclease J [Mycoplasmataceae bacterium]